MNVTVDLSAFDLPISRNLLSEYFGAWAILPDRFEQLVQRVGQLDLRAHIERHQADYEPLAAAGNRSANAKSDDETPYVLSGGIAQIEMIGPMMKYASYLSSNVSTIWARREIRHAADNPDVKAILIRLDSPGGTVSGTKDLADEITRAKSKKPIVAFVEDLTASAAYWIASQCTEVVANNTTALIGSIGTYTVIYDYSKADEKIGIKTHLITTGQYKGAGVPGTEITSEQLADFQRVIDSLNEQFKTGVASGRNMSPETINQLADGRVHPAAVALDYRLIDRIETFESTLIRLTNTLSPNTTRSNLKLTSTLPSGHRISKAPKHWLNRQRADWPRVHNPQTLICENEDFLVRITCKNSKS